MSKRKINLFHYFEEEISSEWSTGGKEFKYDPPIFISPFFKSSLKMFEELFYYMSEKLSEFEDFGSFDEKIEESLSKFYEISGKEKSSFNDVLEVKKAFVDLAIFFPYYRQRSWRIGLMIESIIKEKQCFIEKIKE